MSTADHEVTPSDLSMARRLQSVEASGLRAKALSYKYRFCPNCRREWPAKHSSCPNCVRWLGDRPLERTEWQVTPIRGETTTTARYELIGASALIVRVISDRPPRDVIEMLAQPLSESLKLEHGYAACLCADHGWFLCTKRGLRRAFLLTLDIQSQLVVVLRQTEEKLHGSMRFRWGIWLDQYVVPIDTKQTAQLSDTAANAIFNFEPDNLFQSSEAVYRANRSWEHFVCGPRRLSADREDFGYRLLDHKRPSALDHAQTGDATPFLGREEELDILSRSYRDSRHRPLRVALVAEAGSGKTRLVREWHRTHPAARLLTANFSLFGGDLVSFANQLAEVPSDRITVDHIIEAILSRIDHERIDLLVLDDIHWADPASVDFIAGLVNGLAARTVLALLVTRPTGRHIVAALEPDETLELSPLPANVSQELAERIVHLPLVAVVAMRHAKGNPLFLEHFALWARETAYRGVGPAPATLHQVIAARIAHLSKIRLNEIRQRLRWHAAWDRQAVRQELADLEREIGLWLDRLETGDYGDRVEVSHHLVKLERLDFDIFLAGTLAGVPRPRSSRLHEAIERLMGGSADQILADLRSRAARANDADKINILNEARRAAQSIAAAYDWPRAAEFYALALGLAEPQQQAEISTHLAECRRRFAEPPVDPPAMTDCSWLEEHPAVDHLRLPEVWARLALSSEEPVYLQRVVEAAEAIRDLSYARWARGRLAAERHRNLS